jgi:23S rRNA (guanine745-N1)-methyltransferase
MPTGKKIAATVGDSAEMFAARRAFFAAGFYKPLKQRLAELTAAEHPKTVGDIGCGEGYYIGGVAAALPDAHCFGTDIAKDGIRMAAKQFKDVNFAVADTYGRLPLAEHSVDVLLDVFAPRNAAEFNRVLDPSGVLIVVIPTADHLAQMRALHGLIGIQADKHRAVIDGFAGEFALRESEIMTFEMQLGAEDVAALIGMTPNARFQDLDASSYESIATTAAFELLSFQRLS